MSELTNRVKSKYPQYQNIPDQELESKVLAKYPQYKTLASPPKKTALGFAGNVVKSGATAIKDIGSAIVNVANPNPEKNTAVNMAKLAQGAGQMLDPTKGNKIANFSNKATSYMMPWLSPMLNPKNKNFEQYPKNVWSFYKDRYGSADAIKNTAYNDPVGMGLDIATVATGVGGLAKGGAVAASKAGMSAGVASNMAKAGNTLTKAGMALDPIAMGAKVASKPFSMMKRPLGQVGSRVSSESLLTRGVGNPAQQAKIAQKGTTPGQLMKKYNLYDRSPETVAEASKSVLSQYDDLAMKSGQQVPMGQIIKDFNAQIEKLSKGVGGVVSDADKAKVAELIRRRDQLLQASGGMVDEAGQLISSPLQTGVDTLTSFRRRVIDPDVPQSMFGLDARGSGSARGVKLSRDIIKDVINSTDPRIKQLGLDYGSLKELEKVFESYQRRVGNRQLLNVHKLGSAGLGGLFAGMPGAVIGFMTEQFVNSPEFLKYASKILNKTEDSQLFSKRRPPPSISVSDETIKGSILDEANKQGLDKMLADKTAQRIITESKLQPEIVSKTRSLSKQYLGKPVFAQVKGFNEVGSQFNPERIVEKLKSGGDITDLSRSTVMVDDYLEAMKGYNEASSNDLIPKRDYYTKPTELGYRGTSTSMPLGQNVGEIQFNVPEILFVKHPKGSMDKIISPGLKKKFVKEGLPEALGHEIYAKMRKYEGVDKKSLTATQKKELAMLEKQSREIYEKAWELHQKRMREFMPTLRRMGVNKRDLPKRSYLFGKTGRLFTVDR